MRCSLLLLLLTLLTLHSTSASRSRHSTFSSPTFPWLDPTLPIDQRVSLLISNLTLSEKITLLQNSQPALPRIGLHAYDWWSEASHGIAWGGRATVFPSPIGLASTFNRTLLLSVGQTIANEARGRYNNYTATHSGDSTTFYGLNFFAPNINLFIHSEWGRGQETFGEDPHLTGVLASQFVIGMQGNATGKAKYLQSSATAKHFFVFNWAGNPDQHILYTSVNVTRADLYQSFLPAFKRLVQEAKVESVMCSYNAINGPPACVHPYLQDVLRDEWGFEGFVVSDAGAIGLVVDGHQWTNDSVNATALALNAGCDLDLGNEYGNLDQAVQRGLTSEAMMDRSLARLFRRRVREGAWDPPELLPWAKYGMEQVDTPANRRLAREAAEQSAVLLKNAGGFLPLSPSSLPNSRIAVIGPNADRQYGLLGNYPGCLDGPYSDVTPGCVLRTPLYGIKQWGDEHGVMVTFDQGLPDLSTYNTSLIDAALMSAEKADVVVLVIGVGTCEVQNNEPGPNCLEAEGLDRGGIDLPPIQQLLLHQLAAVGTPVVLVLMGGSPFDLQFPVITSTIPAILTTFYPGEEAGTALASILFGLTSPSGRLPIQYPLSTAQLPTLRTENMTSYPGLSYRYTQVVPMFAFGFGLSYTTFQYESSGLLPVHHMAVNESGRVLDLRVGVRNVGRVEGSEVVQVYVTVVPFRGVKGQAELVSLPMVELKGFDKVKLRAGEQRQVRGLRLAVDELKLMNDEGVMRLLQGVYIVQVGGVAPGSRGVGVDGDDHHWTEVEWRGSGECEGLMGEREREELKSVRGIADGLIDSFTVC